MNSWCESCARKNQCYTADIRPKCYVPLTSNDRTADRKTEPRGDDMIVRSNLEQFRVGLEYHTDTTHFGKVKGESITTNKVEDEPQTDLLITEYPQDGEVKLIGRDKTDAVVMAYDVYKELTEPQTDCSWK